MHWWKQYFLYLPHVLQEHMCFSTFPSHNLTLQPLQISLLWLLHLDILINTNLLANTEIRNQPTLPTYFSTPPSLRWLSIWYFTHFNKLPTATKSCQSWQSTDKLHTLIWHHPLSVQKHHWIMYTYISEFDTIAHWLRGITAFTVYFEAFRFHSYYYSAY